MSRSGVATYVSGESRSIRRRVAVRAALATVLGPAVATAGFVAAVRAGIVETQADTVALTLLATLMTLLAVAALVMLSVTVARPVLALLLAGGIAWALVSVALEATASGAWVGAGVVAACVVVGPLAAVRLTLHGPIEEWRRYRTAFEGE